MGQRMFHHPSAPRIGDYAENARHQQRGRITQIHVLGPQAGMGIGDNEAAVGYWCDLNGITDAEKKETWVSMLVHGGGSVVGPASRFKKIGAFPFENSWACEYFADALTGDEEWIGPRNYRSGGLQAGYDLIRWSYQRRKDY